MALLDGEYITVIKETPIDEIEVSENEVEEGIPLTDHTRTMVKEFPIECVIVDQNNGRTAQAVYEKFEKLQKQAKIVKYVGRTIFHGIIQKIERGYDSTRQNGFTANITLKEIRIAKSPFRPDLMQAAINAGLQQAKNKSVKPVYHTVVRGDCLIRIAKKYGTTLNWIIKHNKIPSGNPNLIRPGEKYLVKEGSTSATVVNQSLRWLSVAEEINRRKSRAVSKTRTRTTSSGKVMLRK